MTRYEYRLLYLDPVAEGQEKANERLRAWVAAGWEPQTMQAFPETEHTEPCLAILMRRRVRTAGEQ